MKPRLPKAAVYFEETYRHDLDGLLDEYDDVYAAYLKERPWNNRVGNWTQLVADFYTAPYCHYPEVTKMLTQQGFGNL